ncbi:MAG: 3TM-type holin [Butyricimonas virosa]
MYRYGFTALEGVKGVVGAVGKVIDRLTLPAREKRQLEAELLELLVEHEKEMARSRSTTVVEEARGNWLQRSWRPLVMLVFALIVLVGTFTTLPLLSDTSRFWDLLEIGLGGYVVGRGGEKMAAAVFRLKAKK